ncbi:hypothetical protein [Morganella morganii]|uniref:hypothetical protein n=1 Tax=Morganella morganii TaxID=582 RepID=UPI001BDA55A3|nr:hypothetical protein [Morganella morganii]ELT0453311.1 hypothetical protein [Morganella morganii]MBT0336316.1 hypothetical protein [Morganella morganii subsp. morganii]
MGPAQGIQGHQAIQTLNNDIYGSADSNSSSSYVSSSGIKSVLLNAWNAVKSAVSGMLSSFGLHLSGQQGSDKPGREIVMDMSSRPAQPLPGMDAQLENSIYESSGENTYDSVYAHIGSGRPESLYASVDDSASVRAPVAPPVPDSPRPSLSEPLYSEVAEPLYEVIDEYQTPPPVPDSPRPSLRQAAENALYERSGSLYDNAEWINAEKKWG